MYRNFTDTMIRNSKSNTSNFRKTNLIHFFVKLLCLVFFITVSLYVCKHVWRFTDLYMYIVGGLIMLCALIYLIHIYRQSTNVNPMEVLGVSTNRYYSEGVRIIKNNSKIGLVIKMILIVFISVGICWSLFNVDDLKIHSEFVRVSLVIFLCIITLITLFHMYFRWTSSSKRYVKR